MDETTKVLIGTFSGFIIAFLAEPVKGFIQNRVKLHNLRVALYKEMLINYAGLIVLLRSTTNVDERIPLLKHTLRTECYKESLANEISLFYQLEEAIDINSLQTMMVYINDAINDMSHSSYESFIGICNEYATTFEMYVYDATFKPKVLRKLLPEGKYDEIASKGREAFDERESSTSNEQ
jgi:hypothetical protein